jgi:hypothetical protein
MDSTRSSTRPLFLGSLIAGCSGPLIFVVSVIVAGRHAYSVTMQGASHAEALTRVSLIASSSGFFCALLLIDLLLVSIATITATRFGKHTNNSFIVGLAAAGSLSATAPIFPLHLPFWAWALLVVVPTPLGIAAAFLSKLGLRSFKKEKTAAIEEAARLRTVEQIERDRHSSENYAQFAAQRRLEIDTDRKSMLDEKRELDRERANATARMRAIARAAFISHPAAAAADFDRCWPEIRDDLLKQHTLQLLTDSAARLDELTPDIQRASAQSMLKLASAQSNSKNHGLGGEHVAGGDRSLQGTYQTALLVIAAARDGSLVRLRALISAGADMNVKDVEGWTPLMVAALKGHAKIVVLLLSHGAHIDAKNNSGWTALRFASSVGDTEMMTLLIGYGADVNSRDDHRQTIMMQAAEEGNVSSIRELLEAGADKEARNLAHDSALSIALRNGHAEIVQLLKKSSSSPIKKVMN